MPPSGGGGYGLVQRSHGVPEDAAPTGAELRAAIAALSTPQAAKLEAFAEGRVRRLGRKAAGLTAGELLSEAVTVTLAGSRKWNRANVDLTGHLMGAMRSISSHWARDFDPEEHPVLESDLMKTTGEGDVLSPFELLAATEPDADRNLEAKEQVEEIRAAFITDPVVSVILDGMLEGMSPQDVRSELNLTQTEYETAMRRLRRKAAQMFPTGGSDA